jgi:hypothetical protein
MQPTGECLVVEKFMKKEIKRIWIAVTRNRGDAKSRDLLQRLRELENRR